MPTDNVTKWSQMPEGQFLERKSAFDRSGGSVTRLKAPAVARQIADTLSAMANADGGELVVGIEKDGTVTGVPHPPDKVDFLLNVPRDRNYVQPPLVVRARRVETGDGLLLLHFETEWSPEVHQLTDGRYLLRIGDRNTPFPAEQIAALKQTKGQGLVERSFPMGATTDDLETGLVENWRQKIDYSGSSDELLREHQLIQGRNGRAVPNLAALLLFGKKPSQWHPRCGIDFVRWEGTERKHGAELNIVKRIRVEQPLAALIGKAYETVSPFIRERQQLVDLFFTERLEYPTFVWQEAIVNAVAHRDYSIQGGGIEIHMYDDRMEIRSPGLPPAPVTVEALNRREHVHLSRNPLIVRVLTGLGYMRELGEGIPRMFEEMEREGFYPPGFDDIGGVFFQARLRNEPVYDDATLKWLEQFNGLGLTGDQKRILVYAKAHKGRFTSREYRKLTGLGVYEASGSIRELYRRGIVRTQTKGGRVHLLSSRYTTAREMPEDMARLVPELKRKGNLSNKDIRSILGIGREPAKTVIHRLIRCGWLIRKGEKRWTTYKMPQ